MTFLLSAVEKDPSCTSQILLDGMYISATALLKQRREAKLEIYPCQSRCCAENRSATIGTFRPVRLHILLSNWNRFNCFTFSLSSGDKALSVRKEYLPNGSSPDRKGPIFCAASLTKGTCTLKVLLSARHGCHKNVQPKVEWRLREVLLETYMLPLSSTVVNVNKITQNNGSSVRANQAKWSYQTLSGCTSGLLQPHSISFDDRKPSKKGLTGICQWNGLTPDQTIKVCKLKFWVTNEYITGFQATYIVNGLQEVGPRNRLDNECRQQYSRIFELLDEENVSCVQVFRHFNGLISHLSVVTDRGRSFSIGTKVCMTQHQPKTLLRHPNSSIVAFRGSFGRGLTDFGFVLEFDVPGLEGLLKSYKCYVCGVICSYFADVKLFQKHVDNCVLFLLTSHQKALHHSTTVPERRSTPSSRYPSDFH